MAIVVLILVAAYRSLGGGPVAAEDGAPLLRSAATTVRRALIQLPTAGATDAAPDAAAVRDGRRSSAAAQQMVDRLSASQDVDAAERSARALLAAAAEDAGWAWRMVAGGIGSPGVTAAIVALAEHAAGCCDEADGLLERLSASPPAGGEPLHGP